MKIVDKIRNKIIKYKKQKQFDEYLYHLGQLQTKRSSDGRLLLPDDDNPEDEELLPEKYRR